MIIVSAVETYTEEIVSATESYLWVLTSCKTGNTGGLHCCR